MAAPIRIPHPKRTFQPFSSWINAKTTQSLVGDGKKVFDGTMTSGSAILTSTTTIYVIGDVGKFINVTGAGVAAADLITTILSFQNAGQVTLNASASTSVNNAKVTYGYDNTMGLQAAMTAFTLGTLYLPSGTYLTSNLITKAGGTGLCFYGDDPTTTTILYAGAVGGDMYRLNGCTRYSQGRITWDGNDKALSAIIHKWDGSTGFAVTHMRHEDEVYKGVQIALRGGMNNLMDAECEVDRCKFFNHSIAGVSVESFNAVDWYIRQCEFHGCYDGVTNNPNGIGGAGNFYAFDNYFEGSTNADFSMYNTEFFGMHRNYSIGSRRFLLTTQAGFDGAITLKNNIILDTTDDAAVQTVAGGPYIFMDNIIRSRTNATGPAITIDSRFAYTDVGNTFTVPSPIKGGTRIFSAKSNVFNATQRSYINPPLPTYWDTPAQSTYPVIEIDTTVFDSTASFQSAITALASYLGQNPIIHIPAKVSNIFLSSDLVFPNQDFQIIGDGFGSNLAWNLGTGLSTPMITIPNGDNVVLFNFFIKSNPSFYKPCILVKCSDVKGLNPFIKGCSVAFSNSGTDVGFLAENFVNSIIEIQSFNHSTNDVGIRADNAEIRLFCGASSDNALSYDVRNGGKILVENVWYESATSNTFFNPTGDGELIINSCKIACAANGSNAFVLNGSHNVNVTLVGVYYKGLIIFSGSNPNQNFLGLGMDPASDPMMTDTSSAGKARNLALSYNASQGAMDVPFVLQMIDGLRKRRQLYKEYSIGFYMDRVAIQQSTNCFHIQPKP